MSNKLIYGNYSIYKDVTSLVATDYGGTKLGMTEDGLFFNPNIVLIEDERSENVTPDDIRDMGANPEFVINFIEWNEEELKMMFNSGRFEDLGGGDYSINFPHTLTPGTVITDSNLLIVPEDAAQDAFFAPRVKYFKISDEPINFKLKEKAVFPVMAKCLIKNLAVGHTAYNNRQLQITKIANIRIG